MRRQTRHFFFIYSINQYFDLTMSILLKYSLLFFSSMKIPIHIIFFVRRCTYPARIIFFTRPAMGTYFIQLINCLPTQNPTTSAVIPNFFTATGGRRCLYIATIKRISGSEMHSYSSMPIIDNDLSQQRVPAFFGRKQVWWCRATGASSLEANIYSVFLFYV